MLLQKRVAWKIQVIKVRGAPKPRQGHSLARLHGSAREFRHVIIVLGNLSPWQVTSRLFRIPRYSELRRVTSTHPRSSTQWRSLAWVAILESTHEGAPLLTGQPLHPPPPPPTHPFFDSYPMHAQEWENNVGFGVSSKWEIPPNTIPNRLWAQNINKQMKHDSGRCCTQIQ